MNLDDYDRFHEVDRGDYLGQIHSITGQLQNAWAAGQQNIFRVSRPIKQIVICGMGGSAIGGELAAVYAKPHSPLAISICRDYTLPFSALNPETLVICSSYSGNTEETISAFKQAQKAGCNLLVLTRGGKIQELAEDASVDVWKIGHTGQPRAAVATSFGLLTALFSRLKLIPLQDSDVFNTVKFLEEERINLDPEAPISKNAAKRLAGQIYGRIVGIVGSDLMAPVAVRWAGQINELAKGWSQALTLPEMDHNSLAGILNPAGPLTKLAVVFINSKFDHPRNQLRSELTRKIFMLEGVNTDFFIPRGDSELKQLWSAIQFGDYIAYYLAMMYEIDPTPIPAIEQLKVAMKG